MSKSLASSRSTKIHPTKGFTLIEMMIVVAVLGILSSIALPSYLEYIRKSRRVDAKNALLDMAARQERFFSINNSYTSNASALGYASLPSAINSSGASYYSLNVTVSSPTSTTLPGFVATATPTGSQTSDTTCYAFSLNQLGLQTNLNSSGTVLSGTTCW